MLVSLIFIGMSEEALREPLLAPITPDLAHEQARLVSHLASPRTIVSLGIQKRLCAEYNAHMAQKTAIFHASTIREIIKMYMMIALSYASWAPMAYMSGYVLSEDMCNLTSVTRAILALSVSAALDSSYMDVPLLPTAIQSARDIYKFLMYGSSSEDKLSSVWTIQNQAVEGKIEFENVSFVYPSRPDVKALNNVSFVIPQGARVAFVGSSGSGLS
jgi:ATP-binding cassette subfamily B (MDR/TAP) protein 1